VVDVKDRIVAWYLPGVMSDEEEVFVFFISSRSKD